MQPKKREELRESLRKHFMIGFLIDLEEEEKNMY
jgi:hypothetical protein